jgi:Skp family chaperone for outer membrane proteins
MKKSKNVIQSLILLLIVGVFSKLNAQNSVYFYRDSVLAITPGYISAIKKVDSLKNTYNKEIQTASQQLNEKVGKIINPYKPTKEETIDLIKKRMSPSDTIQLNLLIKEEQFIVEKTKSYSQIYQQAFDKEVQSILNKVDNILKKYAEANKLDFIYMMEEMEQSLAYMNKKKNITQPIKQEVLKLQK